MSYDGLEDKEYTCGDCGEQFLWTIGEQKFMLNLQEQGKLQGELTEPKRCKECRLRKKERMSRRAEKTPTA